MRPPQVIAFAFACLLLCLNPAQALETDQFTTPPTPLIDLGPEFQQQVALALLDALDTVNQHRQEHLAAAAKAPFKFLRDDHLKKADACLTEPCIVRAVYQATVHSGHAQCKMEMWARYTDFPRQPARFSPALDKTVLGSFSRPITIWYMSPTINLHGVYLGTDKLGHFFEQGYDYYKVYRSQLARSPDEPAALRKAIQKGIDQENGIYGMFIDSIFSNADLAANYAGFKFYLNLTRPLTIAGHEHPPLLLLTNNRWQLNPAAPPDFIKDYISDHWNEAFNPSKFGWPLRNAVRNNVRSRRDRFLAFYNTTLDLQRQRLQTLSTWFGEDYGHCGLDQLVTIVSAQ